jgi:hypothetical protein
MFHQPDYVSHYFAGEEGNGYWEEFVGSSRSVRLENQVSMLDEQVPRQQPKERKAITFVELDEAQIQAEERKTRVAAKVEAAPIPVRQEARPEMVAPQVIHTVVQAAPANDETAEQLAKILETFSFDAIRSEIDHRFEELRRDFEAKPVSADSVQAEPDTSAETATPQIKAEKIHEPDNETAPASGKADYRELIDADEPEDSEPTQASAASVDIMALLAAQAKRMESVSTIEMMEMYGEEHAEVTLEELEKFINKKHKKQKD